MYLEKGIIIITPWHHSTHPGPLNTLDRSLPRLEQRTTRLQHKTDRTTWCQSCRCRTKPTRLCQCLKVNHSVHELLQLVEYKYCKYVFLFLLKNYISFFSLHNFLLLYLYKYPPCGINKGSHCILSHTQTHMDGDTEIKPGIGVDLKRN